MTAVAALWGGGYYRSHVPPRPEVFWKKKLYDKEKIKT